MRIALATCATLASLASLFDLAAALSIAPMSRRNLIFSGISLALGTPLAAVAAPDCLADCIKSCKQIAPKDPGYCMDNCQAYCEQPDRADGLSGSISSANGETGILGLTTVVKGEDKPPQINLPGLDFMSGNGKKLLGY
jgi:hypothetical protein